MPKRHYKRCRQCHHRIAPKSDPELPIGPLFKGIGEVIGQFYEPGPFNFRDFRQARRILVLIWGGGGGGASYPTRAGGGSSGLAYVEFDITERIEGIVGRVGKGGHGGYIQFLNSLSDQFNTILPDAGLNSEVTIITRPPGALLRQYNTFTAFGGTPTGGGAWLAQVTQGLPGASIPPELKFDGINGNSGNIGFGIDGGHGGNAPSFDGYMGGLGGAGGTARESRGQPGHRPGGGGGGGATSPHTIFFGRGGPGGNALVLFVRLA